MGTPNRYLKVDWLHDDANDPVSIFSELDSQGWELRKVELFRDGTSGFASAAEAVGGTMLAVEQVPAISEINSDPQFNASWITASDFAIVWQQRRANIRG